uniref:Uncharacterized protein n=1 Tax=Ditylenchus dipsaci TaxID=166011 RepID=A0A915CWW5_9BILA
MNFTVIHINGASVTHDQINHTSENLSERESRSVKKNQQTVSKVSSTHDLRDVVDFEGVIYIIEKGKLLQYDSEPDEMVRVSQQDDNQQDEEIVSVKSSYGLFLVLYNTGRVYGRVAGVHDDSPNSSNNRMKFVQLELVPKPVKCEHGYKCRQESRIWPKQLDCTQTSVFVVDHTGCVWTFRRDPNIFTQEISNVEVSQVFFGGRIVRSVCCGRAHCIALVDPQDDSLKSTRQAHRQQNSNAGCEKCLENENLRLSVLMKCADEIAQESDQDHQKETTMLNESNVSLPSPSSSGHGSSINSSTVSNHGISHKIGGKFDSLMSWNFRGSLSPSPASTTNMKSTKVEQKAVRKEILHKPSTPCTTSSSKSNSLKSIARTRLEKQNLQKQNSLDIELTTLKTPGGSRSSSGRILQQQQQQFSTDLTGSIQFSFVSLDNVLVSSSDDSASTLASETDFLLSPCISPEAIAVQSSSPTTPKLVVQVTTIVNLAQIWRLCHSTAFSQQDSLSCGVGAKTNVDS